MQSCPGSSPVCGEGADRKIARAKTTQEQAISAIRGLLCYKYILSASGILYDFPECRLAYVPFWKFKAFVTGRVDGYVDEGGEVAYMVPASRPLFKTYTWTRLAGDGGNTGVRYLRNLEYEEEPYDASFGPALRVTVSQDEAVARGSKRMKKLAVRLLKDEGLYGAKISKINVRPLEVALVYYPLWIVRYSCWRFVFKATVDGVTGELLAGRRIDDLLATLKYLFAFILEIIKE